MGIGRCYCGPPPPSPWNPYREDASKGQVTSSCNPPSSLASSSNRPSSLSFSLSIPVACSFFRTDPYSASSRSRPSRARRFAVMGAAGNRDRPIGCEVHAVPALVVKDEFRGRVRWVRTRIVHDLKIEILEFVDELPRGTGRARGRDRFFLYFYPRGEINIYVLLEFYLELIGITFHFIDIVTSKGKRLL